MNKHLFDSYIVSWMSILHLANICSFLSTLKKCTVTKETGNRSSCIVVNFMHPWHFVSNKSGRLIQTHVKEYIGALSMYLRMTQRKWKILREYLLSKHVIYSWIWSNKSNYKIHNFWIVWELIELRKNPFTVNIESGLDIWDIWLPIFNTM